MEFGLGLRQMSSKWQEKIMKMMGLTQCQMGSKVGLQWALDIWAQKQNNYQNKNKNTKEGNNNNKTKWARCPNLIFLTLNELEAHRTLIRKNIFSNKNEWLHYLYFKKMRWAIAHLPFYFASPLIPHNY